MTYSFIKQLTESSLVRNEKTLKNFSSRDIADIIFLYFIALQILRSDFEGKPEAIAYADKTNTWGNLTNFRSAATDLYVLMYTLFGNNNESYINMLENQEASKLLLQELDFDYPQAKKWLSNVSNGKEQTTQDKQFLMRLEAMLLIKTADYRSMRRLAVDWDNLDHSDRQIVMTRLLMALRSKAKRSELLPILEKIAKKNNLEIPHTKNPETEKASSKYLKGATIGAAIGSAIVANSIRKFLKDAGKGKKYTD